MRIVVNDGGVIRRNRKTYGPGRVLSVSPEEADRLIARGAARAAGENVEEGPESTAATEVQEALEKREAEQAAGEEKAERSPESMTVAQLKEALEARGAEVPKEARKAELVALLRAAEGT